MKKCKVKLADSAIRQIGAMSPEEICEVGKILDKIAEDPSSGEPISNEDLNRLIAKGELPRDFFKND